MAQTRVVPLVRKSTCVGQYDFVYREFVIMYRKILIITVIVLLPDDYLQMKLKISQELSARLIESFAGASDLVYSVHFDTDDRSIATLL